MADANSMGLVPVARSRHGAKLYDNPCAACGLARQSEKSKLGNLCRKCSCSAAAHLRPFGLHHHPLYKLHASMRARCEQPSSVIYRYYGGRGIYVCDEWRRDVRAFIAWAEANGYAPGLEIDRIDNDGPYAPWNCQFITHLENCRKKSDVKCSMERARAIRAALADGKTLKEVAVAEGLSKSLIWKIKKGDLWREQ